jgi:hypothetical protein
MSPVLNINLDGLHLTLDLIGEAERTFLFFDVYDIAYYKELLLSKGVSLNEALYLKYERNLSKEKIHEVLEKGIKSNLTSQDFRSLSSEIDSLLSTIGKDIYDGDVLTILKSPNGQLSFLYNRSFVYKLDNSLLANAVWDIWMGEKSVIDRESLTHSRH